jgi:hypothetical protein
VIEGKGAFAGKTLNPITNALASTTDINAAEIHVVRVLPESIIVNTLLSPFSQSLRSSVSNKRGQNVI